MTGNGLKHWTLHLALILVLFTAQLWLSPYHATNLARIMVLAVFAMGYNLAFGYTGLLSLGHALLLAAGMYAAGLPAPLLGIGAGPAFIAGNAGGVLMPASPGSTGTQALAIIAGRRDREPAGLAVGRDWQTAAAQARGFEIKTIAVADRAAAGEAVSGFDGAVLSGEEGVIELIGLTRPDIGLHGIVGAAGVGMTIAVRC